MSHVHAALKTCDLIYCAKIFLEIKDFLTILLDKLSYQPIEIRKMCENVTLAWKYLSTTFLNLGITPISNIKYSESN